MRTKECQRCIRYLREFQIGLPNIRYGSGKIEYIVEAFELEIVKNRRRVFANKKEVK